MEEAIMGRKKYQPIYPKFERINNWQYLAKSINNCFNRYYEKAIDCPTLELSYLRQRYL
jgi:hypothetical protein